MSGSRRDPSSGNGAIAARKISNGRCYVIEVNPPRLRAPCPTSKAKGVPLAKIAARLHDWRKSASSCQNYRAWGRPRHGVLLREVARFPWLEIYRRLTPSSDRDEVHRRSHGLADKLRARILQSATRRRRKTAPSKARLIQRQRTRTSPTSPRRPALLRIGFQNWSRPRHCDLSEASGCVDSVYQVKKDAPTGRISFKADRLQDRE